MVRIRKIWLGAILSLACGASARAAMIINIAAGSSGTAFTGQALAAAQAAASSWESLFSNNITITVQMSFASLGGGILGSASTMEVLDGYSDVSSRLNAQSSQPGKSALANLPSASTLMSTTLPAGYTVANTAGVPNLLLSTADAKALGISVSVPYDATIELATGYYPGYLTGSLAGSSYDFQSVVTHELGHALGFISGEDQVDMDLHQGSTSASIFLTPLDLFRFAGAVPGDFMNTARDLYPATGAQVLSNGVTTYQASTGAYTGDGYQASHWLETAPAIGVMQPALGGSPQGITPGDIWAFQMIGYDLAAPEPGTVIFTAFGVAGLVVFAWRRRAATSHRSLNR